MTSEDIKHQLIIIICSSHVKYLKTNCLKALDILKVVATPTGGWQVEEGAIKKLYCVSIEPL